MKYLVIFAAAFVCVQATHLPYITVSGSWESSEEEYKIHLPATGQQSLSLPGVGVVNRPLVQAVKVKVPRYVTPEIKQQIIAQTLAARGINLQSFGVQIPTLGATNLAARGATVGGGAAIVDTLTASVNPIPTVPITPEVPQLPVVPLVKEQPALSVEPVVSQPPTQPLGTVVPDVVTATKGPVVAPATVSK